MNTVKISQPAMGGTSGRRPRFRKRIDQICTGSGSRYWPRPLPEDNGLTIYYRVEERHWFSWRLYRSGLTEENADRLVAALEADL